MGIIKCQIHGSQGFWEMCKHIWEEFENNNYPKMNELPGYPVKICDKCFENNNVGDLKKMTFQELVDLSEEEYNKYDKKLYPKYKNLDRRCECIQCIKTVELIHAKRNAKKPSFEAFENTLMHKDNKEIEELRRILISNYQFQNFKNPYINSLKAFHIKSGGISYPFSIKFYYITSKKEQSKILHLIDNFFENIPQKQRKISFYEAENWITEKREKGILEYKGKEKLLFEKLIK